MMANSVAFCATPMAARALSTPMASSAPYTPTTWLNTTVTNVAATCITNEAMPSVMILPIKRMSGLQHESRKLNGAVLLNRKYPRTGTMPHAWPRMVAYALPGMPHPHTMTNR